MHYYIIDVETTGVDANINEITEVSIVRCADLVQKTWYLRINNPKTVQKQALIITGKTITELLNREKDLSEVIDEINNFIEEDKTYPDERVMIAHNAPFDRRFCETWWAKLDREFPASMWECTMSMSKKYIKTISPDEKRPKATLVHLIERFNIKTEKEFHGSNVDCRHTYRLRDFLLKQGMKEIQFIKKSEKAIKKDKEKEPVHLQDDVSMDEFFDFSGE